MGRRFEAMLPSLVAAMFGGGLILALSCWWELRGILAMLGTTGVVLFVIGTVLGFRNRSALLDRRSFVVSLIGALIVVPIYVGFATFTERWSNAQGATFTDTKRSWSGRIVYRHILFDKDAEFMMASGAFSESGKPHGEWAFVGHRFDQKPRWYWYGEEVSEGEFRLRSK